MKEVDISNSIAVLENVAKKNYLLAITTVAATKILLESGMNFSEMYQILVNAQRG